MVDRVHTLGGDGDLGEFGSSRSGRLLQTIRRSMDLTDTMMRPRRRNEEILSLAYQDGTAVAAADESENLKQHALNLPYRYARWIESQATSKKAVVKVNRDAGEGQVPQTEEQAPVGPSDADTGMWVGIALRKLLYEAGFQREMKALIGEVIPRGVSVLAIGYHEEDLTPYDTQHVGKDAQSVAPDALMGDIEAHPGQAHAEISEGLGVQASDPRFQAAGGRKGVEALVARKEAHDQAAYAVETDSSPIAGARDIRHQVWLRKRRVGEDVGWAPWVYDTEDTELWWDRHLWTVAQVRASDLFTEEFKDKVEGYDARNISGVVRGGKTVSTESMDSEALQAQGEDVLDDDERMVEWYAVWFRRPNMRSGGIRKIVAPEFPDEFVESDESNPHVNEKGDGLIPGFFPYYDFAPILSSLTVPARTHGIPPMSVGMPQFEKIAEYGRIRRESALRHALRLYQIDPSVKNKKEVMAALAEGRDGYAYEADPAATDVNGKMRDGIKAIQFSGNSQDIDRQSDHEEADWVKVMGMPPAVLQGMGTAETATQDSQGIAAGERESGAILTYLKIRMADVLAGIRGLMRGNYDDEDYVRMLGRTGAAVLKAWAQGSEDVGDEIDFEFGIMAQAKETVERKQLMEAISLEKTEVDPVTGMPVYDSMQLFEELHRRLDVGPPRLNQGNIQKLRELAALGMAVLQQAQAAQGAEGGKETPASGGPSPSEGDGPSEENLNSGAMRGTVEPSQGGEGQPGQRPGMAPVMAGRG